MESIRAYVGKKNPVIHDITVHGCAVACFRDMRITILK